MSNYLQPNAATGANQPEIVQGTCPIDGLPGRHVGSSALAFRCDNGHYFENGGTTAVTTIPASVTQPNVKEEGTATFTDKTSGKKNRP
jgi:hypothetical protein